MNIHPLIQAVENLDNAITATCDKDERAMMTSMLAALTALLRGKGVFIGTNNQPSSAPTLADENKRLREAMSLVIAALRNGSATSPDAGIDFLCESAPREVFLYVHYLRQLFNEVIASKPLGNSVNRPFVKQSVTSPVAA
ncbi:MAG: hypothetical protein WCH99_08740 [Verrucomicrobiota bacterium]